MNRAVRNVSIAVLDSVVNMLTVVQKLKITVLQWRKSNRYKVVNSVQFVRCPASVSYHLMVVAAWRTACFRLVMQAQSYLSTFWWKGSAVSSWKAKPKFAATILAKITDEQLLITHAGQSRKFQLIWKL